MSDTQRPEAGPEGAAGVASGDERRRATAESADRVAVARELGKVHSALGAIRAYFWTMAVVAGLVALCSSGVPQWVGAGLALAFAVGAFDVRRHPVAWSVALAVLLTVIAGAALVVRPDSERSLGAAFFAVLAWLAVPWMRRTRALADKYPDSFASRRLTGAPRRQRSGDRPS